MIRFLALTTLVVAAGVIAPCPAKANGAGVLLAPPAYLTQIATGSVEVLLANVDARQVLVDPKGILWAATATKGLARKAPEAQDWTYLTVDQGLPSNVLSTLSWHEDKLWIGSQTSGIASYDGKTFAKYSVADKNLPGDEVACMLTFGDKLWVVTDAGLAALSGPRFEPVKSNDPGFPRGLPTAMALGPDGRLWVGSDDAEACVHDGKKWLRYDLKGAMTGRMIRTLLPLPEYLWFGTFGSLYVLNLKTGRLDDETKEKAALFPIRVMTGLACSPRCILVGTGGGGVYRMERVMKTWRLYSVKNGLPSGSIGSVSIKGDTMLLGTASGVARVDLGKPLPVPSPLPPTPNPNASLAPSQLAPGVVTFIKLPGGAPGSHATAAPSGAPSPAGSPSTAPSAAPR